MEQSSLTIESYSLWTGMTFPLVQCLLPVPSPQDTTQFNRLYLSAARRQTHGVKRDSYVG